MIMDLLIDSDSCKSGFSLGVFFYFLIIMTSGNLVSQSWPEKEINDASRMPCEENNKKTKGRV